MIVALPGLFSYPILLQFSTYSLHVTFFYFKLPLTQTENTNPLDFEIMSVYFISMSELFSITKTYLYNFDPLKPHFYIVKLGFIGVYIIFLISAPKHRLWVTSNEYTQSMF